MGFNLFGVASERYQTTTVTTIQQRAGAGSTLVQGSKAVNIGGAKSVDKYFSPTIVTQSPGAKTTGSTIGQMDWKQWALVAVAVIVVTWMMRK